MNQSTPASAKPEFAQFDVAPVASGLNGPLQFALSRSGRPYVAEAYGPGTITKVTAAGAKVTAVEDPGTLIGVALRRGTIAYTWASGGERLLKVQRRGGAQRVIGDIGAAEESMNPDGFQAYGWLGYRQACGEAPSEVHQVRGGGVASDPYAVAAAPGGGWYVADRSANAIWKVEGGQVTPVAVFKPRVITVTQEMVDGYHWDPCRVGTRYNLPASPSDVEVAPSGRLFVSLDPGYGGVQDGDSFGPVSGGLAAVVKVNPANGFTSEVLGGLTTASNVALTGDRVYVGSEGFGHQAVIELDRSTGQTAEVASVDHVLGLEWKDGDLWATHAGPGGEYGYTPIYEQSTLGIVVRAPAG